MSRFLSHDQIKLNFTRRAKRVLVTGLTMFGLLVYLTWLVPNKSEAQVLDKLGSASQKVSGNIPTGISTKPKRNDSRAQKSSDELWKDVYESELPSLKRAQEGLNTPQALPQKYRALELNQASFKEVLAQAPMEFAAAADDKRVMLSLPLPDGRLWRFYIQESPIMSPELATQFPEIKSYSGQGIDEPAATVRFSWDPAGLKAFVLSPQGSFTVLPYFEKDDRYYTSAFTRDVAAAPFECLTSAGGDGEKVGLDQLGGPYALMSDINLSSNTLREYRLSFSVTQQFYQRHGGAFFSPQNDSAVAAAITAFVNNLNLMYVTEISTRFRFYSWYADRPGLCGIPGSNCFAPDQEPSEQMKRANQYILDNVHPGSGAYDLGIALGHSDTGPGGLASFGPLGGTDIGAACQAGFKGQAAILLSAPAGSYWSSVILAHELGHMFGARHTFSSNYGPCGGQLDPQGMVEPGSGSTIMSYAPGCAPANLYTGNSSAAADPYFHTHSLLRILNHKNIYSSCGQTLFTGNSAPAIMDGGTSATVPAYTPFILSALASDPNGDEITYNWEEWDPGSTIFRSYLPSLSPARSFPDLFYVLNYGGLPPSHLNGFFTGEALPSTTRTLNFTVTVRDNRVTGAATAAREQLLQVHVRGDAGPFLITYPNTPVVLPGGRPTTIRWNVANTNLFPISTSSVRILLSTDGGNSFPTVLASTTPNDGIEAVTLPNIQTSSARIGIEAVGNIFFDITDTNFGITPAVITHNRNTVGVFRPSNGVVYLKNSNTPGFSDIDMVYGIAGDQPIAGDWNGDHVDTLGIYRNGTFYLRNSNTTGPANIAFPFGAPGDQPIAGDWDGDGVDTVGVYRPSTGVFYLRNSNTTSGGLYATFVLGNPGDIAIAGDWNGDGVTTTGVFRPSNGIIYLKDTNTGGFAETFLVYGNAGDKPLAGDWDGNGADSVGIYRNGLFYLRNSNTQGFADLVFALGNSGDVPLAGDWDGLP